MVSGGARGGVGLALLAAVTLDGMPENLALGTSLATGVSLSLLVAIFFFQPAGGAGRRGIHAAGRAERPSCDVTWIVCAIVLAAAVVLGRGVAGVLSEHVLAVALAFAGGAVLASLADTLMPEAFEQGRPLNAFATCAPGSSCRSCSLHDPTTSPNRDS